MRQLKLVVDGQVGLAEVECVELGITEAQRGWRWHQTALVAQLLGAVQNAPPGAVKTPPSGPPLVRIGVVSVVADMASGWCCRPTVPSTPAPKQDEICTDGDAEASLFPRLRLRLTTAA